MNTQQTKPRKAYCVYIDGAGTYQAFACDVRHENGEHQFLVEGSLPEVDAFLARIGFERV